MRRFVLSILAVMVVTLFALSPVAAAVGGGGSGTYFSSDSTSCSTSGGHQVCTGTSIFVYPNGDGTESACVDVFTYSISSTGQFRFISDENGCATAGALTVGSDLSVALASTTVTLSSCNRRGCTPTRSVTVAASDTPSGPISTTTARITTTSGGCTYRTTTREQDAPLAGTLTIDGVALDETGFVQVIDETTTVRCK